MPRNDKAARPDQAKDSPTRAPESGEPRDRTAHYGTSTEGKDDVRTAPESGDKASDSISKKR